MKKCVDMHTHSTASDGSMEPSELVRHAAAKGLAAIALTDHDTMDGVSQALAEGVMVGMEVIPGVEISVDFEPEMHILGYFFDDSYLKLEKVLSNLRKNRGDRNLKVINKLRKMGIDITMTEVEKEARGTVVGRVHIASVLFNKGYVSSIEEAFERYLLRGRPAYFKKEKLTPEAGIDKISNAGGIPVLAHPILLGKSEEALDALLYNLKNAGLIGIEAYYVNNTPAQTDSLLKLAAKHELLVTGGSDFHGTFKDGIEVGIGRGNLCIPYELLEGLKKIFSSRKAVKVRMDAKP